MDAAKSYFFIGVGGSGMLPLALVARAQGHQAAGSDRALDQGRLAPKFAYLQSQGVTLYPQDGSGVAGADQIVVASAAVEDHVPDMAAARRLGARIIRRADLLAELFNAAETSIAVGGTSGKSTVTAMIGWILHAAGADPTIVNGAVMNNFASVDAPFASAAVGKGGAFVAEVDESDGTIALYNPAIAVLNNVSLDHKSMDELPALFRTFLQRAAHSVVNVDNAEAAALAAQIEPSKITTVSRQSATADVRAQDIAFTEQGVFFTACDASGATAPVRVATPGLHTVSNALMAIAAARAYGVPFARACAALADFKGVKRRLETVGTRGGVVVIDDFAHNPDKIAATLDALHAFPGRLLIMFQPHGFGPLRMMRREFVDTFAEKLAADDVLIMPEPVYFGGTTDRSVSSKDITQDLVARGVAAEAFADRDACAARLLALAKSGDRILVMGARDDTLSDFALDLLQRLPEGL